jgi:NAD(P)-dependent dehydrogenase (short-subunit alcohol dehydrogenase family)
MNRVLISGATRGIGRAIALRFAREGWSVAFCGRDEEAVRGLEVLLRKDYGIQAFGITADMGNKTAVQQFAFLALEHLGGLDVLVNNAGQFIPGAVGEEADGVFEAMIQVNLAGAYHITRAVLPALQQSPRSHIFNICSTASIMAYTNGGSYCISKFGLLAMSKLLRAEYLGTPLSVTAVLPGATHTDSWAASGLPASRFMQADDIAEMVWNCWTVNQTAVVEELLIRPRAGDI